VAGRFGTIYNVYRRTIWVGRKSAELIKANRETYVMELNMMKKLMQIEEAAYMLPALSCVEVKAI